MCECALTKPGRMTASSKRSPSPRSETSPTAAMRPSSPIATAPCSIGGPSTGTTQSADSTRTSGSLEGLRVAALPATLHEGREPDRELVQHEQRDDLEEERDRVDGGEQDREDEHHHVADPPVAAE